MRKPKRIRFNKDDKKLLAYIFLIVVILISVYLLVVAFLGMQHFLITVESNSMEPSLQKGDVIIIKKENNYQQGDIIAFDINNEIYIHRIIAMDGVFFRTKGDRNVAPDLFLVERHNIIGKVIFVVPKLGYVNLWLAGK